jgi:hypothetical protein
MEKLVGRKRKTTDEKGEEHHPVAILWARDDLAAGEDDLCGLLEESIIPHLLQICVEDLGSNPVGGWLLIEGLRHWSAMSDTLNLHKTMKHSRLWSSVAERSARKKMQWWQKSRG